MKKLPRLFVLLMILAVIGFASCKKCYHCQNDCVLCVRPIISTDTVIAGTDTTYKTTTRLDSSYFCNDAFTTDADFNKAITLDTSVGYICVRAASSYSKDFCVNNPGQDRYPSYYNMGGRIVCDQK